MQTEIFEHLVTIHSLCPGKKLYNAVALAGEVGEVCNNFKKMHMANERPEWVLQERNPLMPAEKFQQNIVDELGDVLFYLVRVALDNGTSLSKLMEQQAEKLAAQSEFYDRIFLK